MAAGTTARQTGGLKEKISGESLLRLASFGDPGFLGSRGRSRGGRSSPTACGRSGAFILTTCGKFFA